MCRVLQVGYLNVQRSKGEKISLAWLPEVGWDTAMFMVTYHSFAL